MGRTRMGIKEIWRIGETEIGRVREWGREERIKRMWEKYG